jgi:hypothetical protein
VVDNNMARVCILNTHTNKCINVLELENETDWTDHSIFIKAPRGDGEIGWTLLEDGEWDTGEIPETLEQRSLKERQRRDKYLMMFVDTLNGPRWEVFTEEQKTAWIQYRLDLLNVPQQEGFPDNIMWPTMPE